MTKKTYIIKDKGKGQIDTVDPNSLVSISEQIASNGIQSIVPGDNISIDNTDPQNPIISVTGGGDTPTLLEVLTQDNNAEDKTIKFSYDDSGILQTAEIGFLEPSDFLGKVPAFGTSNAHVTPAGFYAKPFDSDGFFKVNIVTEYDFFGSYNSLNINTDQTQSRGITASQYYGANYDDNTYVQKRYVDSVVFNYALKKPTIEGTSGQVLTADRFGSYAWKDVEVQTYLQSITGYDEEATQTLKNINGVMTWVTD